VDVKALQKGLIKELIKKPRKTGPACENLAAPNLLRMTWFQPLTGENKIYPVGP
jgi:hypothetical protein